MLQDVVAALQASERFAGIAVTSSDATVLAEARRLGAVPLIEPVGAGLNSGLNLARDALIERGAEALLVLPGDVPQLDPSDIHALVAASPLRGVILVEAEDGGTTALLLRPPAALPFCFGPDSARAHRQAAMALGLPCEVMRPASLAWDIDRPADLDRLAASRLATNSRHALARLGSADSRT